MEQNQKLMFKDFLPLMIIFITIFAFVLLRQLLYGFDGLLAMRDFMGAFFIVFASLKLINLKAFAQLFSRYDILAQKSIIYAYSYPFLELMLGILFLKNMYTQLIAAASFILMLISSIGVAKALASKEQIACACLGAIFKIPMTYISLLEDVLMAAMSLVMLFA